MKLSTNYLRGTTCPNRLLCPHGVVTTVLHARTNPPPGARRAPAQNALAAACQTGDNANPMTASLGDAAVRLGFADSANHDVLNRIVLSTQLRGTYLLGLNCCKASQLQEHIGDLSIDKNEVVLAMMASASDQLSELPFKDLVQVGQEFLGPDSIGGISKPDNRLVDFCFALASELGNHFNEAADMDDRQNEALMEARLVACFAQIKYVLHKSGASNWQPSVPGLETQPWWPEVDSVFCKLRDGAK